MLYYNSNTNVLSDYICDKLKVIGDIAIGEHVEADGVNPCDSASSNEAYVLATCNTSLPEEWHRGQKVNDYLVYGSKSLQYQRSAS